MAVWHHRIRGGAKAGSRRTIISAAVLSIGLHAAVGVAAAAWIVAKYLAPAPAKFESRKVVRMEPELREHSIALAEFDAAAPAPAFNDRLLSSRLLEMGMPALPKIPLDQTMPLNPAAIVADSIAAVAGQGLAGLGAGQGAGGSGGDGMTFFGIRDSGQSVVIMIDISGSMFLRLGEQAFQPVKEQAITLINGLGINSRFGVVVWSGGAGRWKEQCVPATDAMKASAMSFIRQDLGPDAFRRLGTICRDVLREGVGGTRHDLALRQAFAMQPEVIYMLSDGNALAGDTPIPTSEIVDLTRQLQRPLPKEARLHTIYFMTGPDKPAERDLLKSLASHNGGRFSDFDAKTTAPK